LKLESVVPWGRSLEEYRLMFSLSEDDLRKSVLGCGDGPASFNAELAATGSKIISVDPIYQFSPEQVSSRIDEVYPQIMDQMSESADSYVWDHIKDVQHLGMVRMAAMRKFLSDYQAGLDEGRYINASLPQLPFDDGQFDLALCSHFLFLYSEQIGLQLHLAGMKELCRVSREVRVYPLLALDGNISPHLKPICDALSENGLVVNVRSVEYQFQKGAVAMLVVQNPA
jgi:SAM-dependent methyltransferase